MSVAAPDLAHAAGRDPRLEPVAVLVVDEPLVGCCRSLDHRLHHGLGDRAAVGAARDLAARRCPRPAGSARPPRPRGPGPGRTRRTRRRAARSGCRSARCRSCRPPGRPGSRPAPAVPELTVSTMSWVTWSAVSGLIAWLYSSGSVCLSVSSSGDWIDVDDVGLHHHALVGDPGRDHRHLERRGPHFVLADGGLAGLRLVGVVGEGRDRLRADVVEVVVVEAERLRLVLQGVRAQLDPELGEGGVAGVLHRLAERDLVGAAVAALVVDLAGAAGGLRQLVRRTARHLAVVGRTCRSRSRPTRSPA